MAKFFGELGCYDQVELAFDNEPVLSAGMRVAQTIRAAQDVHGRIDIKMTSESQFVTFGYRAFLDVVMEKCRKNDIGCLIHDIWLSSLFWTFSWKNQQKNDVRCLILDIWASSLFCTCAWKDRYKNHMGCLIL